ncbi:MAG: hypothetical protein ABR915_12660, partial [Thermoguttaceae bacterium]
QLESVSPVFGVVMHQGKLCAAAGRHPELDGGIRVWGLEPDTGAIAWSRALAYSLEWCTERVKTPLAGYQNRLLGESLRVDQGVLYLGYLAIDPAQPHPGSLPRIKYVPSEKWW